MPDAHGQRAGLDVTAEHDDAAGDADNSDLPHLRWKYFSGSAAFLSLVTAAVFWIMTLAGGDDSNLWVALTCTVLSAVGWAIFAVLVLIDITLRCHRKTWLATKALAERQGAARQAQFEQAVTELREQFDNVLREYSIQVEEQKAAAREQRATADELKGMLEPSRSTSAWANVRSMR